MFIHINLKKPAPVVKQEPKEIISEEELEQRRKFREAVDSCKYYYPKDNTLLTVDCPEDEIDRDSLYVWRRYNFQR
jgi:hypothetical protein